MRELKQDWRDIFGSFRVAFDVWKLLLAFCGVVVTFLVLWGLTSIPANEVAKPAGWIIALVVAGVVLVGAVVKFALSDTGFTASKAIMFLLMVVVLAGGVLMCVFTDTARAWGLLGGVALAVLVIWAFFGGAITRIASVEIATDDRIGLGESVAYARRKYGAYLGATVLPAVAVLFLALCCVLFGLLFRMRVVDLFVTLVFFFLVPIAGFLMFLIGFGGVVGAPLMYPAVSSEGNDSFDAISRAYSYVFGRPWRYIFYNAAALVYGVICSFFVAFFVKCMLQWALASVDYGAGGRFGHILPRLKTLLSPINNVICDTVGWLGIQIQALDVTGYISETYGFAQRMLNLQRWGGDNLQLGFWTATAAVLVAICIYVVIGLVVAYIVSLFFSMQTTIYLLLRKGVDGAEMTEVYREEDEEDYLSVTPEAPEEETEEATEAEAEEKSEEKSEAKGKAKGKEKKSD